MLRVITCIYQRRLQAAKIFRETIPWAESRIWHQWRIVNWIMKDNNNNMKDLKFSSDIKFKVTNMLVIFLFLSLESTLIFYCCKCTIKGIYWLLWTLPFSTQIRFHKYHRTEVSTLTLFLRTNKTTSKKFVQSYFNSNFSM